MTAALRFSLNSCVAHHALAAVAGLVAAAGCGDGIGTPIRRAALEEVDAGVEPEDAAIDAGAVVEAGAAGTTGGFRPPRGFPMQPGGDICANVAAMWPEEWAQREIEMYELVAELRSRPEFVCQGEVYRGPGQLELIPELRCSARMHSADMAWNNFFMIVNPAGGLNPQMRVAATGFQSSEPDTWGVLIEKGRDPQSVFESLLQNNRYACLRLPNPSFDVIGIGYAEREGRQGIEGYWTLDFARR